MLSRGDATRRKDGICREKIQPKVFGIPSGITGVFDGDGIGRIVFAIQESGQAENPVAVGAGWIATEGNRKQFQSAFLLFERKALNSPEDLVLTELSGEDCARCGNRIRKPE